MTGWLKTNWRLAVIVAAALLLRTWDLGSQQLSHFDEGVYAYSSLALTQGKMPYPAIHFYAPPMLWATNAAFAKVTGLPPHRSGQLLSIVAATGTVLLVGVAGAMWFTPPAGLVAAGLVAFSEYHIWYARRGLTEALLCLMFLLAMTSGWHAIRTLERRWIVLAGVFAGLTWETKYNGWFTVVILGLAVLLEAVRDRDLPLLKRRAVAVAAIGVIAALIWAPWMFVMARSTSGLGGYAAYLRTFLSPGYWPAVREYWEALSEYSGPLSAAAAGLALVLAGGAIRPWGMLAGVAVMLSAAFGGLTQTLLLLIPCLLYALWRSRSLAGSILISWILLWVASAPLYQPYPRLLLPMFVALSLAAGCASAQWIGAGRPTWSNVAVAGAAALVMALGAAGYPHAPYFGMLPPWGSGSDYQTIAREAAELVPNGATLRTAFEPEVAYFARLAGVPHAVVTQPVKPGSVRGPSYFIYGANGERNPWGRTLLAPVRDRIVGIHSWPSHRGEVVLFRLD